MDLDLDLLLDQSSGHEKEKEAVTRVLTVHDDVLLCAAIMNLSLNNAVKAVTLEGFAPVKLVKEAVTRALNE